MLTGKLLRQERNPIEGHIRAQDIPEVRLLRTLHFHVTISRLAYSNLSRHLALLVLVVYLACYIIGRRRKTNM